MDQQCPLDPVQAMWTKGVFCGKGVCGWVSVTCETEGDFWAFSCESLDSVLSCLGNISAMQKREVSVCYQWNRGGFCTLLMK